jgi:hypothetical protein
MESLMLDNARHFARECISPDVVEYAIAAIIVLAMSAFLRATAELEARMIRAGKIDPDDDDMSWW